MVLITIYRLSLLERYKNNPFTILKEAKRLYRLGKSGTSVYMDRKILSWIDEKIKESVYRNRSHAVEYAVIQLMKNDRPQRHDY